MARACLAAFAALIPLPGGAAPPAPPPFRDIAAEADLDFVRFNGMTGQFYLIENMGSGAALFDYDNDGWLDLQVANGGINIRQPLRVLAATGRIVPALADGCLPAISGLPGILCVLNKPQMNVNERK